MKALRLDEPGRFAETPDDGPGDPGPGETLVGVLRVGVCGTDFNGYHGRMPFIKYPRILGHELSVEVIRTGPDVAGLAPGDRCAVEPYLECGACPACSLGRTNCCEQLKVLGVHVDGGLRPRLRVPARKLHASSTLPPEALALVEPLAVGAHGVERGGPMDGQDILIIGAGPIGLSAAMFCGLEGGRVSVTDVNPRRLEFARKIRGVVHAGGPGSTGRHHAVVFDATGRADSMSGAIEAVEPAGRLVYLGVTSESVTLPDPLLHQREVTVLASRNALPGDFRRVIRLAEEGRIDALPWITHHAPLAGVPKAFPDWTRPETGVMKAMIDSISG